MVAYGTEAHNSNSSLVNTLTCNVPSGTQDGDLLVWQVTFSQANAATFDASPAGWERILDVYNNGGGSGWTVILWKIAASEPASYTQTWTGPAARCVTTMVRLTSPHPTLPIYIFWGSNSTDGVSTSHTLPEVWSEPLTGLALGWICPAGDSTFTVPSGYSSIVNVSQAGTGNQGVSVSVAYKSLSAETPAAATWTTSNFGAEFWRLIVLDAATDVAALPMAVRAGRSSWANTGTTSRPITKPLLVREGDRLLAFVYNRGAVAVTPDVTWDTVSSYTATGSAVGVRIFSRIATASEPSTYTFTFSSSAVVVLLFVLTGVHKTMRVMPSRTFTSTTNSSTLPDVTIPSPAPRSAFRWCCIGFARELKTVTTPTGYSPFATISTGSSGVTGYLAGGVQTDGAMATQSLTFGSTATTSGSSQGSVYPETPYPGDQGVAFRTRTTDYV